MLHQLVREELATFLERAQPGSGEPIAPHVPRELNAYLRCGLLAHGFARVRCPSCRTERLVAFSCKGRGICPSCGARRMNDSAARLVDRVLPRAPYRQWVLTVPFALRYRLARDPKKLTEVLGELHRALGMLQRRRARELAFHLARTGAVTFVQRFGSALNLHLHFHAVAPDGVFVGAPGGELQFVPLPAPSDAEVRWVVARVAARVEARRRRSHEEVAAEPAVDALGTTQLESLQATLALVVPRDPELPKRSRLCATVEGYTLHADVAIGADDREGLERLCRYGARPALALSRLRRRPDGRLVYRVKRKLADGSRELVLEPQELMRRLAALVPPPRANLLRYHGVLAPASKARKRVVATALRPERAPECRPKSARNDRLDWASLLQRTYKFDVLTCVSCGGKAKVIALIDDRAVVRKILAYLGLPTDPLPLLPARRPEMPELPLGGVTAATTAFNEWMDEPVDLSRLPAWMRQVPAGVRRRARGPADFEQVDEPVRMERLPAWMRVGPLPRRSRRTRWAGRRRRVRSAAEHGYWPDEEVDLARLPQWMRGGSFWGPAPPNWDGVDAPGPGAEALVDPIYDEPA